jgi:hypothetical protein
MKSYVLVYLVLLISTSALSSEKDQELSLKKQIMTKALDDRILTLQTTKMCVTSATDLNIAKHCYDTLEKARKHQKALLLQSQLKQLEAETPPVK